MNNSVLIMLLVRKLAFILSVLFTISIIIRDTRTITTRATNEIRNESNNNKKKNDETFLHPQQVRNEHGRDHRMTTTKSMRNDVDYPLQQQQLSKEYVKGIQQCGTTTTYCPIVDDTYGNDETTNCCYESYSPTGYGCLVNVTTVLSSSLLSSSSLSRRTVRTTIGQLQDVLAPAFTRRRSSSSSSSSSSNSGSSSTIQEHITTSNDVYVKNNKQYCCKPGAANEPSTTIPNCLIIGDSVSIGYTPYVTSSLQLLLHDHHHHQYNCQVQHSPYDVSDGGASDTNYGMYCLQNFLRTQQQTNVLWDIIVYNFGLHNLNNSTSAKQQYMSELYDITLQLLLRQPQAKLFYATTTPYMIDAIQNNTIVEDLNTIAINMIQTHFINNNITIIDLHKVITDHCGTLYESCDYCDMTPCSYHYSSMGYQELGKVVANAIQQVLL